MRDQYVKDHNDDVKHERDDDWPLVIVQMSDQERVIYDKNCKIVIEQFRTRNRRNDKWLKWQFRWKAKSHEEMRKALEKSHSFASDSEKLDAICLLTDDGDYMEHSH